MVAFVNEEQWSIDGIPLSTWAYNIESIGGRQGIPPMAGNNIAVPFRRGELWRPKLPAPRTLSLGMWVRSSDAEGVTPKTAIGRRAQFNENLRTLRNIFYNSERELVLTKNVRYLNGIQAYATKVECLSTLDPTMAGPNFGRLVVDLKMADPYWTSGPISKLFTYGSIPTITNPGDDISTKIFIDFRNISTVAPGTGITVTNTSTTPNISFTIPAPAYNVVWTMDVENFSLIRAGDDTVNYQSTVSRSGSAFWMELKKGVNNFTGHFLSFEGNPMQWEFTMTFYPVYL